MASCFEFFLSLKFGKRAKGFLWRTTKAQAQPQLLKAPKSSVPVEERDLPWDLPGHNF
ncbi:hypothetical protein DEO72_LG5g2582 [Vigna unguiculata]|uniref:Uncharacterized protein n=1 Tax=Vigna unguiculata TaxID=3917 RepID=A0A4D6M1M1_VIGUN|nr:hypothetical protein DEO72_LG5g2582 [Vigna unguiculata]